MHDIGLVMPPLGFEAVPGVVPFKQRWLEAIRDGGRLPEIHQSDISTFKTCQRQWGWSSPLRGNLTPVRLYLPFFTGSIIHAVLEKYHAYGIPIAESLDSVIEAELAPFQAELADPDVYAQVSEELSLIKGMLAHYELWERDQVGPFRLANLEFLTLEQEFNVPIIHPITGEVCEKARFAGKLDGLVRRKDNGDVYIWELKTTSRPAQRAKMLYNDPQASYYANAVKLAYPELAEVGAFKGLLYTLLVKKVPPPPKVLVNGMLSSDIRYQSFQSYAKAIEVHHAAQLVGLDEGERNAFVAQHYGTQLSQLYNPSTRPTTFFERHIVTRNDAALRLAALELWHLAERMTDDSLALLRNEHFNCAYCSFYEPCMALQNGLNVGQMLADGYVRNTHGNVAPESEG